MFKSKKFKHGSLATALTIGFIAIVVIINIVVGLIIDRLPVNLDLTSNGVFEIGEDTKTVLGDLNKNIEITVIGDKNALEGSSSYYKQIGEIIELYPKYNSKIKLEWIELDKNPEFANEYADEELNDYDVIIRSDLRYRIVNISDMLEYDQQMLMYYQYGYCSLADCIKGSTAEQEMTSAIMYVSDDNPVKVAFLNMGEEGDYFATFRDQLLGKNAYETVNINILTEEIPEDTKIAIVCAPTKDYSVNEITKLESFLDNGGKSGNSLMYIAPTKNYETPIIDEFLKSWGIEIGTEYIAETDSQNYYQTELFVWQNIESTDYTMDLGDIKTMLVPMSHPVSVLYDAQTDIQTQALITTNKTAIKSAGYNTDGETQYVGNKGIMNSAVVSVKTNYSNAETKSYVYAFGSEYMFYGNYLTSDGAEYLISLFNTNTGKSEGVSIIAKSFESETLELSDGAVSVYTWIFVFIIPAVVIAMGIIVAIKRKNR